MEKKQRAFEWIERLTDPGSFREWKQGRSCCSPYQDRRYRVDLEKMQKKSGVREAVVTGECRIGGQKTALGVMDPGFFMGTMGQAAGEAVTSLFEKARQKRLPVVLVCASGGARIQEGIFSLMQMEKTAAAVRKHGGSGLFYLSVLTDPTLGGVTASFGMLGDVMIGQREAVIGFAGRRVMESLYGQPVTDDFQRAKFQLEHGFLDRLAATEEIRQEAETLLKFHKKTHWGKRRCQKRRKNQKAAWILPEIGENRPWEQVQIARDQKRPDSLAFAEMIFEGFTQLHGDRLTGEDPALAGGLAWLGEIPVTVLAIRRGKGSFQEGIRSNFGMPMPEGYRKAARLMVQAEKFGRPVICLIDTPGADCSCRAEERGQAAAIARCLETMAGLGVPVLSVITGEGESGGALALAGGNEVWMLENAVYSVISPEGCAAVLWKGGEHRAQAAERLRLTSGELLSFGIVDRVIPEKIPARIENMEELCGRMREEIRAFLFRYGKYSPERLRAHRYHRFRKF